MSGATSTTSAESMPRTLSLRPIDHRWDRSRGIVFNHSKKAGTIDFTWSREKDILFSSRAYSTRPLRQPPPAKVPPPPMVKPQAQPAPASKQESLLNNPNRISAYNIPTNADQIKRLEAARDEERRAKEAAEKTVKRLEEEKAELQQQRAQDRAQALSAARDRDKDQERAMQETRQQEKRHYHKHMSRSDEALAEEVKKRHERESEIGRLESKILQMDLERRRELKRETLSHDHKLEHARASAEQDKAHRAGGRANYDDYRKVFDNFTTAEDLHNNAHMNLQTALFRSALSQDEKPNYLDRVMKLDPWLKRKHPQLVEKLSEWISEQRQTQMNASDLLNAQRLTKQENVVVLRERTHQSRRLTRYHHLDREYTSAETVDLVEFFANDRPFRHWVDELGATEKDLRRRLKSVKDESERTDLTNELTSLMTLRSVLHAIMGVHRKVRRREMLQALLTDSVAEKEAFAVMLNTDEVSRESFMKWSAIIRESELSNAPNSFWQRDQHLHREAYRLQQQTMDNVKRFVKKRAVLEASLGLLADKEDELDDIIQSLMRDEKSALIEATEQVGIGRLTRRQRTAFARPVGRAASAPAVARRVASAAPTPVLAPSAGSISSPGKDERLTPYIPYNSSNMEEQNSKLDALKKRLQDLDATADEAEKRNVRLAFRAALDSKLRGQLEIRRRQHFELTQEFGETHHRTRKASKDIRVLKAVTQDPRLLRWSARAERRMIASTGVRIRRKGAGQVRAFSTSSNIEHRDPARIRFRATASMRASRQHFRQAHWRDFHSGEVQSLSELGLMAAASCALSEDDATRLLLLSHARQTHRITKQTSEPNSRAAYRDQDQNDAPTPSDSQWSDCASEGNDHSEHVRTLALESDASISASEDSEYPPSIQDPAVLQDNTWGDNIDSPNNTEPFNESEQASCIESEMADNQVAIDPPVKYNISAEDRRAAAMASRNSNAAFWSYRLYKNDQGQSPTLHYCTTATRAEEVLQDMIGEKVLGFDLEWEPRSSSTSGIKKNVSLIQIASESRIVLLQIALFTETTPEELVPNALRTILEDSNILKTGVNISGDATRMRVHLGVDMKGVFELSHLYRVVKAAEGAPNHVNRKLVSLSEQVQTILLLPMKKDEVRTSAWSKRLNIQQCDYAGSDAYAGFRIFHELEAKRKTLNPMPPRPAKYELFAPLVFADGSEAIHNNYKKSKPAGTAAVGKAVVANEEDDNDDEEFYDAAESLELSSQEEVAGVPLSGIEISYPSLPLNDGAYADPNEMDAVSDLASRGQRSGRDYQTQREAAARGSRAPPPTSPEVDIANAWVSSWQLSRPEGAKSKTGPSALRAYHLWHQQGLELKQVARLARDPPLQAQTVAGYVLQVVQDEGVPFDADRVRKCFDVLPHTARFRFWKLWDRLSTVS